MDNVTIHYSYVRHDIVHYVHHRTFHQPIVRNNTIYFDSDHYILHQYRIVRSCIVVFSIIGSDALWVSTWNSYRDFNSIRCTNVRVHYHFP